MNKPKPTVYPYMYVVFIVITMCKHIGSVRL